MLNFGVTGFALAGGGAGGGAVAAGGEMMLFGVVCGLDVGDWLSGIAGKFSGASEGPGGTG